MDVAAYKVLLSSQKLNMAGLADASEKPYLRSPPAPQLPALLFLAVYAQLPCWRVNPESGRLRRMRSSSSGAAAAPDAETLAAGVAAALKQFSPPYTQVMF